MREYNHKKIEAKWQKRWAAMKLYRTEEDPQKPKCYVLDEFPYPSGEGLHAGHTRIYTASDVYARMKHMQGYNVLHPSGWDAFGLPAEQFAMKHKVHPSESVKKNTKRYREQMERLGLSYDWEREINTTDPAYYKWTQWAFLKMYERGLAYQSFEPINWCPTCQTGLANEDLDGGNCERCDTPVEKKPMRQWMIRMTDYADRLLYDLDALTEWPEAIKEAQRNWIGRSEGVEFQFPLFGISGQEDRKHSVTVFTTRPDTLFGATYIAISAELAKKWIDIGWKADKAVKKFIAKTLAEEMHRAHDVVSDKEGIATGIFAENPANKEKIPVWVANYVLSGYGTGAIMAVPAHDERDFEFAKKFHLPIREVIEPTYTQTTDPGKVKEGEPFDHRETIIAIVKHWSEDKYLALRWEEVAWGTFITGGIEEGQSPEEAARMEIEQETGFLHCRFIKDFGVVHGKFYHVPKKTNRNAHAHICYLELQDDERVEISEKEKALHEVLWLSQDELKKFLTPDTHRYGLKILFGEAGPYTGEGTLTNSGKFNRLESAEAKTLITQHAGGARKVIYKLKDWVFSRQRYWGEPIPVVHCAKDGVVPVPERALPVTLPEVRSYAPTGTEESPLANIPEWVNTTCPMCGGPAKRETNTMPQWAGSSWYYLRFMDPKNPDTLVGANKEKYWTPVDVYVGGAEHVTRHLIYARFWHKFLFDIGVVSTIEPFKRRKGVGLVLGGGGVKMSKRLGNVINPDDIIARFGADTLRVYEMFMGPFGAAIAWSTDNLVGARRFIERVWRLAENIDRTTPIDPPTELLLNQTIKKVEEDIEDFAFNTAISQLMILLNHLEKLERVPFTAFQAFICLLAPFAPHITDELWEDSGHEELLYRAREWPKYDPKKIFGDTMTIAIQVNGKLRGTFSVTRGEGEEEIKRRALLQPALVKWLEKRTPIKIVYVPGKIVNIVVS